jgi:hypothetical protein
MKTRNGRFSVAAVTAVAWAMVGAASCAKGATETDPLSGSTSAGEVGVGGAGGSGGATAGTGGAGGGVVKTPCTKASQCPTNVCQGGVCAAATCINGKLDGSETDQDCGGPECGPCLLGKQCVEPSDCSSGICKASVCDAFDCTDGKKNGSESDIDCGGSNCPSCGAGQACVNAADCGGAPCNSGKCKFEVTFTTCGQTGATGPTQAQCDATYGAGNALKGKVTLKDGYQLFTVPNDGTYQIEAFGAEGGKSDQAAGGAGARMRGDFMLKKGDVLKLVVGQRGSDGQSLNVGGGGGTFVAVGMDKALLVAGGGGGAGACGAADKSLMGAKSAMGDGKGGTSNGDGNYCGCGGEGSGGGGFTGDGGANGGKSFLNGALGCTSKRTGQCADPGIGGFGGGGNGGNGGAGGGGYQGGNAGGQVGGPSGRGGLSFNNGANQSNADAFNAAPGKVTIKSL